MIHKPDNPGGHDVSKKDEVSSEVPEQILSYINTIRYTVSKKKPEPSAMTQKQEALERLRRLKFGEFKLQVDMPREFALETLEHVYDTNLVPDEALDALAKGDLETCFTHILQQGGMLNRFTPTPLERQRYPLEYQPVCDQMYDDLLGRSGKPGEYRVFTLNDEHGDPRVWLSCRLPPRDPRRMPEYQEHLEKTLFRKDVHLEEPWPHRIRKRFPRVMEWDTVNVDPEFKGAGTVILHAALEQIQQEYGANTPDMIYHYRFAGFDLMDAYQLNDGNMVQFPSPALQFDWEIAGDNNISANYVRKVGSTDVGYKMDENERVVRETNRHLVVLQPKWRYSSALWEQMFERTKQDLQRKGLK